jgi:Cu-Zn family superoxide dismutase
MTLVRHALILVATAAVVAGACSRNRKDTAPGPTGASATIRDLSGATVGTASFTETSAGVLVSGSVTGLGSGTHGVHVHETGRCDPPFTSAGAHFNPGAKQHGFRNPNGPHAGDMPNISVPATGSLRFDLVLPGATLSGDRALLDSDGASIVIHEAADDYVTDPAGNSGARIACGAIVGR